QEVIQAGIGRDLQGRAHSGARPAAAQAATRPPRVLLVIPELDMGGAEVQLVRLATHLHLEGIAPEVAVFHAGGHLEPALLEAGIPVHHVRRTSKVGMETIFHLRRILKEGRYEIVHTWLWSANWRGRIAGILASTPIIISGPQSVDSWMRVHHIALDWI